MKRNLWALAVAVLWMLLVAGCQPLSRIETAISTASDFTVPPQLIVIAANSFDAIEVTAKNVLVACTPAQRPAACNDTLLRQMIGGVRSGRDARAGLEGFLRAHPGQLGSKGLYDILVAATDTINKAVADYNGRISP